MEVGEKTATTTKTNKDEPDRRAKGKRPAARSKRVPEKKDESGRASLATTKKDKKSRRGRKKHYEGYRSYIRKIARSMSKSGGDDDGIRLSGETAHGLDACSRDLVRRLCSQSTALTLYTKKHTIKTREISTSIAITFAGRPEISDRLNRAGQLAVDKYNSWTK